MLGGIVLCRRAQANNAAPTSAWCIGPNAGHCSCAIKFLQQLGRVIALPRKAPSLIHALSIGLISSLHAYQPLRYALL